jgi:hypothetical protein
MSPVLWLLFSGAPLLLAGAAQAPVAGLTYTLNAELTNGVPYYAEITGLPSSTRLALVPMGPGTVSTDGSGRIAGLQEVDIPSIGGTFQCDARGTIRRYPGLSTTVSLTMTGKGLAFDAASNSVTASFKLSFSGGPLEFASQHQPIITVRTNVATISSDGSVDATGALIWFTNTAELALPQTNEIDLFTYTNLVLGDGTWIPIGLATSNYNLVIPPSGPVGSFSFTNDWAELVGTLKGSVKAGKASLSFTDNGARFVQTHVTNWLGDPVIISNQYYAAVYSLLVPGNMELNTLDAINAEVIQTPKNVYASGTNYSGNGSVSTDSHSGLVRARVNFTGQNADKGSSFQMTATNGTLITSYRVNSNAPPVVVAVQSAIGVPPVLWLTNTVSGILTNADFVNYVTNDTYVIESHYGPVDLTNPHYLTNVMQGVIKPFGLQGKIKGQSFSGGAGVNQDAPYQLLPIGVEPAGP